MGKYAASYSWVVKQLTEVTTWAELDRGSTGAQGPGTFNTVKYFHEPLPGYEDEVVSHCINAGVGGFSVRVA